MNEAVFQSFFLIFTGAAIIASLAIYGRQPLLVAYIALGALIGPYGLGWVQDVHLLSEISEIGIIFLLFLLGLDLQPQSLMTALRKVTVVTLISSALFAAAGYLIAHLFGFNSTECLIIGAAMMFSSTIIGIKLLPTTILHHRHIGNMMIGLLLMQDFLAIFVLLVLLSGEGGQINVMQIGFTLLALPLLILFAWAFVRWVLLKLIAKFDRMGEYIFLLAIGWCMGLSELAEVVGLSREIGAFLAGITLASSPISQHIALTLKPLRDFFLIMFFFSLGAGFNLGLLPEIALASVALGGTMLILKPAIFRFLLGRQSEKKVLAWDIGFRLGQISEFSLLIAYVAFNASLISVQASHLIQAAAILTFLLSSYIVIFNFPNPIAVSERLRRN
ncbi:cation:proton antiporter [Porticoccus litoralis]|uniref:Cation:proton antiporter n=1 Tax=Porticoccus litoralis TaxID=434086 RepID=A0AAW8B8E1_9GAMM|nr:cation:proton antiporter [Porticoccus litoralis]MDP1521180.1 cation:proton antiporter [Porticoccus litoralis]